MQNSSALLNYRVGCSYDITVAHFSPSLSLHCLMTLLILFTLALSFHVLCQVFSSYFLHKHCCTPSSFAVPVNSSSPELQTSDTFPYHLLNISPYIPIPDPHNPDSSQYFCLWMTLNSQFVFNSGSLFLFFTSV